jgi:hypothetical protein
MPALQNLALKRILSPNRLKSPVEIPVQQNPHMPIIDHMLIRGCKIKAIILTKFPSIMCQVKDTHKVEESCFLFFYYCSEGVVDS